MATSMQVADGIRDLSVDWGSADELHEVLTNLHQVAQAMHDKFQLLADKLQEQPPNYQKYSQAIAEVAGDFATAADKIEQAVGEGLVKS